MKASGADVVLRFVPQLDCCGPTGTVIDAAKDICPKKEGLEVLITTVTQVTQPCLLGRIRKAFFQVSTPIP